MNYPLIIMSIAVVGYLVSCVVTWRRLNRADKDKEDSPGSSGGSRG